MDYALPSYPIHSVFEGVSGFACICLAVLLLLLRRSGRGQEAYVLPCAGLIMMGILDIFHACLEVGNLFVATRTVSTLLGSVGFAAVWIPLRSLPQEVIRRIPFLAVVIAGTVCALSLGFRDLLPAMTVPPGGFSALARGIHFVAGTLFIAAALYFLRAPRWGSAKHDRISPDHDRIYILNFCLLQAASGFAFPVSHLWSPLWWAWHALRVLAALVLLAYAFRRYQFLEHETLEAQASGQKSSVILETVFEGTTDTIYVKDRQSRYVMINSAGARVLGVRVEDVLGKDDTQIFPPDTAAEILADDRSVLEAGQVQHYENAIPTKDDVRVFLSTKTPYVDADGRVVGIIGIAHDITERQRDEVRVRRYAARMKSLTDASRGLGEARLHVASILDTAARHVAEFFGDGCVVRLFAQDVSHLYAGAFHHVDPEALHALEDVLPGTSTSIVEPSVEQVVQTGEPVLFSGTPEQARSLVAPDYRIVLERFPIHSWIVAPLRVAGKITGVVIVFRFKPEAPYSLEDQMYLQEVADRTALAIENAQLYEAAQKAVQVRDNFMAIASHELKTPLTPLKVQLQLLKHFVQTGAVAVDGSAHKLFHLIDSSDAQLLRLARLTEDLLDVSRISAGLLTIQREACDLPVLVDGVIERFRSELEAAKCRVDLHADGPIVARWDCLRIEQVVTNLLTNAMKYGAGKPIEIHMSAREGMARLTVRDFGIGIATADQERIFDRFERAVPIQRFGGLGMGLYIARQIVEAHGGRISVESVPGEGSLFSVELPL